MFAIIVQIKSEICKEKVYYVLKRKKINLASKQILFCRAVVSVFTETVLSFISDKVSGTFLFFGNIVQNIIELKI